MNGLRRRERRTPVAVLAAALLLACAASRAVRAEEPVAVKGVVVDVRPGILYLKDIERPGKPAASGSMMFLLDDRTEFYTGLERTHRDFIAADQIVLVRYVEDKAGKKALLVRIIGRGTP